MSTERLLEITNGGLSHPQIGRGARLTEELWNAAHFAHAREAQLHATGSHGFGIVNGLQVTATHPPSRFVAIHPGLAVDPLGRPTVVSNSPTDRERRLFNLSDCGPGWVRLVLEYRDDRTETPDPNNNYIRVLPYAQPAAIPPPPANDEPIPPSDVNQLELARVLVTQPGQSIRNAVNPLRPGAGEIDLRFRTMLCNTVRGEITIGQIFPKGPGGAKNWEVHRVGTALLRRELQTAGYQVQLLPLIQLAGDEVACDLLCLGGGKGLAFTAGQIEALRAFILGGGVLFAESCQPEFEKPVRELARELRIAALEPLPANHALLTAHHVFSGTPQPFAAGGKLLVGRPDGAEGWMLLSTCDYGCAWEGARELARDQIRIALEFGVNLAAFSAESRTTTRLEKVAEPVVNG